MPAAPSKACRYTVWKVYLGCTVLPGKTSLMPCCSATAAPQSHFKPQDLGRCSQVTEFMSISRPWISRQRGKGRPCKTGCSRNQEVECPRRQPSRTTQAETSCDLRSGPCRLWRLSSEAPSRWESFSRRHTAGTSAATGSCDYGCLVAYLAAAVTAK